MKRRTFITILCCAATWPLAARTLQSGDRFQMPASFASKFRGAR
jgi:hypothetical protein